MTVISTRTWIDEGRTRAQLRTDLAKGRLVRLRRGVFMEADEPDAVELHRRQISAAAATLGPETVFGHESAAVLHHLPLLAGRLREVVVLRTGGGHGAITPTLHARRAELGDSQLTVVDGYPTTTLERTTSDLVRRLTFPEAVMLADAALRMGVSRDAVGEATARGRGCRMAARALGFADPLAESAGESLSRVRMHQAGLPMPELQHKVYDCTGVLVARLDFWWEEFNLAGEFDGMIKYGRLLRPGQSVESVVAAEKRREQRVLDLTGGRMIRWTWPELWDGELVARLRTRMAVRP